MSPDKLRRYTQRTWKGPKILVSWMQRRCEKCQRFLARRELKYCRKCATEVNREQKRKNFKEWRNVHRKEYREYHNLQTKIWTNSDRYQIGDYV